MYDLIYSFHSKVQPIMWGIIHVRYNELLSLSYKVNGESGRETPLIYMLYQAKILSNYFSIKSK